MDRNCFLHIHAKQIVAAIAKDLCLLEVIETSNQHKANLT